MKQVILDILEEYAWNQANLSAPQCRERLAEDIMKAIGEDSRDLTIENKRQIGIFDNGQTSI